jgi:hypothetical protein
MCFFVCVQLACLMRDHFVEYSSSQVVMRNLSCTGLVVEKLKDKKDRAAVIQVVRTAIMSKQFGLEDFLAELVADACS